jgi:hypothetical protein
MGKQSDMGEEQIEGRSESPRLRISPLKEQRGQRSAERE